MPCEIQGCWILLRTRAQFWKELDMFVEKEDLQNKCVFFGKPFYADA